jgi:hypothetical protein
MLPLRDPQRTLSSLVAYETDVDRADAGPTVMTIAIVRSSGRWDPAAVAACLAERAATDELVVVYGSDEHEAGATDNRLVIELSRLLPRYTIVTLHLGSRDRPLAREAALLDECLELGSLPVVATRASAAPGVAADLYDHLRVDRVVTVSSTVTGVQLQEVCRRPAAAGGHPAFGGR